MHILGHTFRSHLAMRGAPAKAIQELAGHQDLSTTQRYLHLRPAALDADYPSAGWIGIRVDCVEIVEKAIVAI